ncbi:hypothetical protein ACW0FS_004416, partial [Vibrio vulnificus]
RLSGIHAAWHFWYAVSFSGESGLQKAGLSGIHPLTRRYVQVTNGEHRCLLMKWLSLLQTQ